MSRSLILAMVPLAVAETLVWAALFYVFPALLPVWEADFGWSRGEVAGAFTASLIVTAFLSPQAGRLIDRGRSNQMFLIGIVAGAALLVTLSMVQTLWQFWAVWIAIGVVNACILYEACFAIITVTIGARAKQGITVVTLFAGFAGTVCFPAYYALTEAIGWRGALQVFAAITALISLPAAWWGLQTMERHREPAADRAPQDGSEGRAALGKPAFWWIAIGFASTGLLHGMVISHIRTILAEAGVAVATAVLIASMIGPMQVLGRVVMVSLGTRINTFGACMGSFTGMTLGVTALLLAGVAPWLAFAFVVPYGAAYGIVSIVRPVLAAEFLGRAGFGVISGMLALPYVLGGAIGPLLAAWLWSMSGYGLVLQLALGLVCFAFFALFAARRSALGR